MALESDCKIGMKLYIAVIESEKRAGRRVKLAIHASSRRTAEALAIRRFTKWTLRSLHLASGQKCIAFQDEFPA